MQEKRSYDDDIRIYVHVAGRKSNTVSRGNLRVHTVELQERSFLMHSFVFTSSLFLAAHNGIIHSYKCTSVNTALTKGCFLPYLYRGGSQSHPSLYSMHD